MEELRAQTIAQADLDAERLGPISWTNETRTLGELMGGRWPRNPRVINEAEGQRLTKSIQLFGQVKTFNVSPSGKLLDGHQRSLVWTVLPQYGPDFRVDVRVASRELTEAERERLVVYLHRGTVGRWDWDLLATFDTAQLLEDGFTAAELEFDLGLEDGLEADGPEEHGSLVAQFVVPPFTVLDARQGYWQERKRAWIALGIHSELGRGDALLFDVTPDGDGAGRSNWQGESRQSRRGLARAYGQDLMKGENPKFGRQPASTGYAMTDRYNAEAGRQASSSAYAAIGGATIETGSGGSMGTSIFDPVLCEVAYAWFCPRGGRVLDPFAGGSVRGIVAAALGREYVGVDLSEAQVEANRAQATLIRGKLEAG